MKLIMETLALVALHIEPQIDSLWISCANLAVLVLVDIILAPRLIVQLGCPHRPHLLWLITCHQEWQPWTQA